MGISLCLVLKRSCNIEVIMGQAAATCQRAHTAFSLPRRARRGKETACIVKAVVRTIRRGRSFVSSVRLRSRSAVELWGGESASREVLRGMRHAAHRAVSGRRAPSSHFEFSSRELHAPALGCRH